MTCADEPHYLNGWNIQRNSTPPYDCILTVVEPNAADSGQYQCYGVLTNDEIALSNVRTVKFPSPSSSLSPGIVATIVLSVVVIILILTLVSVVVIVKIRCKGNVPAPTEQQSLLINESNGYSSTSGSVHG